MLDKRLDCRLEEAEDLFDPGQAAERVTAQYAADAPALGLDENALPALGALLGYLTEAQRGNMSQLRRPDVFSRGRYMELDASTRRHLELTENLRTGEKKGSLLWVLDKTRTPMGARLLRAWVERPLLSVLAIKRRHAAVGELVKETVKRSELMLALREIHDLPALNRFLDGLPLKEEFIAYTTAAGVKPTPQEWEISGPLLLVQIRALIGRNTPMNDEAFYPIWLTTDNVMEAVLKDG
jgi:DNA mismatch repair protein MutS